MSDPTPESLEQARAELRAELSDKVRERATVIELRQRVAELERNIERAADRMRRAWDLSIDTDDGRAAQESVPPPGDTMAYYRVLPMRWGRSGEITGWYIDVDPPHDVFATREDAIAHCEQHRARILAGYAPAERECTRGIADIPHRFDCPADTVEPPALPEDFEGALPDGWTKTDERCYDNIAERRSVHLFANDDVCVVGGSGCLDHARAPGAVLRALLGPDPRVAELERNIERAADRMRRAWDLSIDTDDGRAAWELTIGLNDALAILRGEDT